MPEIDTDLFQLIVMGLLVILLLVLLIVLNNLTKLAKGIDDALSRSAASGPAAGPQDTPAPGWDSGYTEPAPQQSYAPAAQTAYEPVPQQTQQAATPQQTATEAAAPARSGPPGGQAEPMPEEQPFERDGRWWFKRGNELLIYDEQQGQWQPAPAGSLGQTSGQTAATEFQSLGDSGQAPASAGSDAGWKCPSCGAVNGATASTCRMCFAARP